MNNGHIYIIQVLFVTGIAIGSEVLNLEDKLKWLDVVRYTVYILTISAVPATCKLVHRVVSDREPAGLLQAGAAARAYALVYSASVATLLLSEQRIFNQDFVFLFLGYLVVKYPEMAEGVEQGSTGAPGPRTAGSMDAPGPRTAGSTGAPGPRTAGSTGAPSPRTAVNYGVGMACSYFEGYLVHILPSDGHKFVGFEENIRSLEDNEGVLFPVKKMFIVITKSLYSPPDLKEFNRGTDVPYLEAFNILPDVRKSVAGVKDRIYHNTAYKVYRPGGRGARGGRGEPGAPAPPVCLTVECASPLHTLYKVICNRSLYDELAEIDIEEVKSDFCNTLQSILNKSHECRGKCELIFYDHEDPTQNLSEILLKRIRELCPNFEDKIIARRAENKIIEN